MKIRIEIDTNSDSFRHGMNAYTSYLLQVIAKKLDRDEYDIHVGETQTLWDANKNRVGSFQVTRD